jgi:Flp pilus assembly protein TadG
MVRKRNFRSVFRAIGSRLLGDCSGSQLLELAIALPFLLVMAVAVSQFSGAFNLKQILNNAAREGARVAANEYSDFGTLTNNCANASCVAAVAESVSNYLKAAGAQPLCAFKTTTIWSTTTFSGTFTASGGGTCSVATLTVERAFAVGGGKKNTRVTLTYPNPYTMGGLISLLTPGSTTNLPRSITSDAIMPNIF